MHQTNAQTQHALAALISTLQAEISAFAARGDTYACDLRHSAIANVERTMALLDGERD